jgi:hypothetical protein
VTRFVQCAGRLQPGSTALTADRRRRAIALALTVVTVGAAGVLTAACGPSGAAAANAGSGHRRQRQAQGSPRHTQAAGATALSVVSVSPNRGAKGVDGANPVRVQFSAPVAASSPVPALRPRVPGRWSRTGTMLLFTPSVPLEPGRAFTLHIPGGRSGVRSATGGVLAKSMHVAFRTQGWSTLRLEQLLAQLHFLPLTWVPQSSHLPGSATRTAPGSSGGPLNRSRAAQLAAVYSPPPGTFTWRRGYPTTLTSLWRPGKAGLILTGAVMAFEAQHHMTLNHTAGPRVWAALLKAVAKNQHNSLGYTYAVARKGTPETLTVWHNSHVILHTLANTGIPAAPTADGTFPVYLRFQFTIMSGFNPDGSHYSDPVWWVSYFNGGDAVHYFPRASYGFPQSLGCVELQWGPAKYVWPYMNYGTLVSVVN